MRRMIFTWLLGVALLVGLAAGCAAPPTSDEVASLSDGAAAADTAGTTTTTADAQDAMLAFVQCMRDHGVEMEDPTVNDDGGVIMKGPRTGDRAAIEAADEACQSLLPKSGSEGGPKPDPEQEAKMRENALAFAACMREHGVDMADPQFGDGTMSQSLPEGMDPDDPAFADAEEACQSLIAPPDGIEGGPVKGKTSDGGGPELSVSGGDAP